MLTQHKAVGAFSVRSGSSDRLRGTSASTIYKAVPSDRLQWGRDRPTEASVRSAWSP